MPALYYVNITIHILAAMLWLGGMFFLGLIGAPVLRAIEPPTLRQGLFQQLGLRFRSAGWGAIAVLIITGVINLHYRGWLRWDGVLGSATFWSTRTGHALAMKLTGVTAMLVVSSLHDFILGPRAGRAIPGSPRALAFRHWAILLARANALLGVLVVIAAVLLTRGG
jgi:uncharacterized membrane protein